MWPFIGTEHYTDKIDKYFTDYNNSVKTFFVTGSLSPLPITVHSSYDTSEEDDSLSQEEIHRVERIMISRLLYILFI